jgi:tellurite resistance protein TehA-like permease
MLLVKKLAMKIWQMQTDSTITATILTIIFSIISLQELDILAKLIAICATIVSLAFTSVYYYYKIKKIKHEKNIEKH